MILSAVRYERETALHGKRRGLDMWETFIVDAKDQKDKVIGRERLEKFPSDDEIIEIAHHYNASYIEVRKRYEILPFE